KPLGNDLTEYPSIDEISNPHVFRLSPFREMGQAPGVAKRFGSLPTLQKSLTELQERIYS
ncbi:MAG TPA: hypothetical protein DCY42_13745, partial [Chloroflexi bacterium]|nr:hypothetical protein [Chloroflexota bacterium]